MADKEDGGEGGSDSSMDLSRLQSRGITSSYADKHISSIQNWGKAHKGFKINTKNLT